MSTNVNDNEQQKFGKVWDEIGVKTILVHGDNWRAQVADFASLPSSGNIAGDFRQTLDDWKVYKWSGTEWVSVESILQNSKSANYTLVSQDAGKHIYHPAADTIPRTFTIPANASVPFPIGTAITFVNDVSAGAITIAITSDTLILSGPWSTGSRTLLASGVATIIKITSTKWIINGTNLS